MASMRNIVLGGVVFKLLERTGTQIIGITVSIILARLLEPEVVGVVSLAEVFVLFFNVIASYGFGNSLIQKKDADDTDFATGFFSSLVLASILYMIIWCFSPVIERFYNYSSYGFTSVLRVLGTVVFANAVKSILQAVVAKRFCFKLYFYCSIIAIVSSGAIGISMACQGYGIWALAAQNVIFEYVYMISLWCFLKWHPVFAYSGSSFLEIWKFGWKLILYGLLNVSYMQLRSLIIAKKYSSEQLAFFNRGFRLAKMVPEEFGNAIMAILFPVFSSETNFASVKDKVRRSVKTAFYLICPLLFGLFAVSDNFIIVLLTEKWLTSAVYLRIFCMSYLFYIIQTIFSESIKSMGRSGVLLLINLSSKTIGILLIIATYNYGVIAISLGFMVSLLLEYVMYAVASRILLKYTFPEQIRDIASILFISAVMAVVCYLENRLALTPLLKLFVQIFSGGAIYLTLSFVLKNDSFKYLLEMAKSFLGLQKNTKQEQ